MQAPAAVVHPDHSPLPVRPIVDVLPGPLPIPVAAATRTLH